MTGPERRYEIYMNCIKILNKIKWKITIFKRLENLEKLQIIQKIAKFAAARTGHAGEYLKNDQCEQAKSVDISVLEPDWEMGVS